ncbi:hypothetical protein SELMODRAFT_408925 [Selaginella moellendorffii]|uniref:Amino acid transporter transmembrane domain-containing protein n=1 Tax=Selaginella moellendorffii TaxID=88036 RepID=D8R8X0_SELML|nr:hypothetical protein SELMODRAFT_408925 [Selaginella moellendorffii]
MEKQQQHVELESGNSKIIDDCCKNPEQDKENNKATLFQASVNSIVLLIGLGTLSSAYAIERSGFFGLFVLLITASFYWCGSKLISKCLVHDPSLANYQDVATKAFPSWAPILVRTLFYLRILGTLTGYLVSMGDTLTHIFPSSRINVLGVIRGKALFTCMAFLLVLPTTWFRNLRTISYLTFWCGMSILATIVCLVVAGADYGIGFDQPVAVVNVKNLPLATGVYTFTFGSTPVLPNIQRSMENQGDFPKVMVISFATAITLNVIVGILGAIMFGSQTRPQVHLNMPPHLLPSKIAIWATFLTPVTQFALLLSPIAHELEQLLLPNLSDSRHSPKLGYLACVFLRSMILSGIALAAVLFPYFVNIIQLIGSSLNVTLCIIMPCLFYVKIFGDKVSRMEKAGLCAMVVLSAIAGITGATVSIKNLIHKQ